MPLVHVYVLEGRTNDQKRELVQEMTRVMVEVMGSRKERVNVLIHESEATTWAVGGQLLAEEERGS